MGKALDSNSGESWWMAEGTGTVAVFGTHLFFWGYYATDARRGAAISDCG